MKFTPEFIAKQREAYDNAPTNARMMAGADGNNLVACYGYDEKYDKYEFGQYAGFGNAQDATYAHEALSNYPDALDEIERLRAENAELRYAGDELANAVTGALGDWYALTINPEQTEGGEE